MKTNAPDDEAYLAPELVAGDAGDGSADSEVNHELGLVGRVHLEGRGSRKPSCEGCRQYLGPGLCRDSHLVNAGAGVVLQGLATGGNLESRF